jgi:3-deoxy-D-manno-octulosonic-acid transferase
LNLFSLFYFFLATVLTIVALPFLLLLSLKQKYRVSIPRRFFLYKNPPFKTSRVWFHVCSFGEAISLKPLLERLNQPVNISLTTTTGFNVAKKYDADVRYLPFESLLPFWVKAQKVLVVSEAELWYMLFFMAKLRGAKTILINARISDNSYRSYQKFAWFYKKIFALVDVIFAQSEKDKQRLIELGAKEVHVTGNIKAYGEIKPTKNFPKPSKEVLTLASTHAGEEALLLDAIDYHDKKIIVVPRHPERFKEVGELLADFAKAKGLSYHAFSQREDFDSDVIMIDKMGALINIYAISDVVFLGGSFVENVGGHNPLEPATFGCKILSGIHIFNQRPLFELVENINIVEPWEIRAYAQKEAQKTAIKGRVDIDPIIEAISDVV